MTIERANSSHLGPCEEALSCSELGRRYFSQPGSAQRALAEGIEREEILVCLDDAGICGGFMKVLPNGSFHSFPYLHLIAVKENRRNEGIGRLLMDHFEAEHLMMKVKPKVDAEG